MDTNGLQEKVLTMLEGGYTKIAIADRLGISDEHLDYLTKVVMDHKTTIRRHIRDVVLSMDIDELNQLKVDRINMSSIVTKLISIYGSYEEIPKDTPALVHVLKHTGAYDYQDKKGRPFGNADIERAQALLDIGIKKTEINKALNAGKTFVTDKVRTGFLDDTKWKQMPIGEHKTLREVGIE